MKFEFEKPKSEIIRDNHGCAWLTEYKMKFTVDGIEFTAEYADTYKNITLLHNCKQITHKIMRIDSVYELGKIKDVIKKAFSENKVVNKAFHELKGDTLDVLKEHLCKDLLSNDDWS